MKNLPYLLLLFTCVVGLSGTQAMNPNDPLYHDALVEFEEQMASIRQSIPAGRLVSVGNLVNVLGEEPVKLTGFGVVTGLQGSGDSSPAAKKMLITVAEKQGIRLKEEDIKSKNVAIVSLSAEVSPHERTFDVAVKSIGDAKSLQNGHLEGSTLYPLGSDEVFAVVSGPLGLGARFFEAPSSASGATASLSSGSSVTIGHPTTAFVIAGGQMIRELPSARVRCGRMELFLKHPDSRTATNVANVINRYMKDLGVTAYPASASLVTVNLESFLYENPGQVTRLIADICDLPTTTSLKATITIDQGSGVIAMTEGVKMEPGSIAVAGLTVTVTSDITPVTRQGLTDGETAFFDVPDLQVSQASANFLTVRAGTDLRKVQETLNALKLTPTSIISVFNAMHEAGMIHADIKIIPR